MPKPAPPAPATPYRGRLAPSPTGFLHLGHAHTFWIAQQRCLATNGTLILRNEDLDAARCQPTFAAAVIEDLRWFGLQWHEGPDIGGPHQPYNQSERLHLYRAAFSQLHSAGFLYPCSCSRKDIQSALTAPHAADHEPIYPGTCRPNHGTSPPSTPPESEPRPPSIRSRAALNWRFRVPDNHAIRFVDAACGPQSFVAGRDFGDFVVWRHDDLPAYQLAVVVDDAAMRITEVVRGEDLLLSTARQLLLYQALGLAPPGFCHCPLLTDPQGRRLAKRHDALSLRTLRQHGATPESLRAAWH